MANSSAIGCGLLLCLRQQMCVWENWGALILLTTARRFCLQPSGCSLRLLFLLTNELASSAEPPSTLKEAVTSAAQNFCQKCFYLYTKESDPQIKERGNKWGCFQVLCDSHVLAGRCLAFLFPFSLFCLLICFFCLETAPGYHQASYIIQNDPWTPHSPAPTCPVLASQASIPCLASCC